MKIIEQKVELYRQLSGLNGIYKAISRAGHVCYATETGKLDETNFTNSLIKNKHLSPLEFGTVYLKYNTNDSSDKAFSILLMNKYSKSKFRKETNDVFITTNMRVLVENNIFEEVKDHIITKNKENKDYLFNRYTFTFTTSIGISRELNRHRCHSICEQSTRYCNYSNDKFGNELTFIKPYWISDEKQLDMHIDSNDITGNNETEVQFKKLLCTSENAYLNLLNNGCKPQEARDVLPLQTKTIVTHCAFDVDWEDFFNKRLEESTGNVHPEMKELATMALNEILKDKASGMDW